METFIVKVTLRVEHSSANNTVSVNTVSRTKFLHPTAPQYVHHTSNIYLEQHNVPVFFLCFFYVNKRTKTTNLVKLHLF